MKYKKLTLIMAIILIILFIPTSLALEDTNITQNTNDEFIALESEEEATIKSDESEDIIGQETHVPESTIESLVKTIRAAGNGDTIYLDGKTYTGNHNQAVYTEKNNLKIYGGSSPTYTAHATIDF